MKSNYPLISREEFATIVPLFPAFLNMRYNESVISIYVSQVHEEVALWPKLPEKNSRNPISFKITLNLSTTILNFG